MRDLIDDPHPEFTAQMMADLTSPSDASKVWRQTSDAAGAWHAQTTDAARKPPQSLAGGDIAVGRSSVHAGASEGTQRAPHAVLRDGNRLALQIVSPAAGVASIDFDHAMTGMTLLVSSIYDAAIRVMGPDPIPLAGTGAWAESDEAYRERLSAHIQTADAHLDIAGHVLRLPRARLVPVPVQQEP